MTTISHFAALDLGQEMFTAGFRYGRPTAGEYKTEPDRVMEWSVAYDSLGATRNKSCKVN